MTRTSMGTAWIGLSVVAAVAALAGRTLSAAEVKPRYFELRIYTAAPGKMDALHAQFRDHTMKLFMKHGIQNVVYWTAVRREATRAGSTSVSRLPVTRRAAITDVRRGVRQGPSEWIKVAGRIPEVWETGRQRGAGVPRPDGLFADPIASPRSLLRELAQGHQEVEAGLAQPVLGQGRRHLGVAGRLLGLDHLDVGGRARPCRRSR